MGKYEQLGTEIGKLVDVKNADYGSSFSESHKILEVLFPNGISLEQMKDALFITRVVDKLFRIATRKNVLAESASDDIAGYALLQSLRDREERAKEEMRKQMQIDKSGNVCKTPLTMVRELLSETVLFSSRVEEIVSQFSQFPEEVSKSGEIGNSFGLKNVQLVGEPNFKLSEETVAELLLETARRDQTVRTDRTSLIVGNVEKRVAKIQNATPEDVAIGAENLLAKQIEALGKLDHTLSGGTKKIGTIVDENEADRELEALQYSREVDESGENVPYVAEESQEDIIERMEVEGHL